MDQFDPNIPGLIEGTLTSIAVSDPQPFIGGVGNKVVDPGKPFTLTVKWEVFGQLAPLWLAALAPEWSVSIYVESMADGPEVLLGLVSVPTNAFTPTGQVNGRAYSADVVVPVNKLQEGNPGGDVSGIYKLLTSVFLDSAIPGEPGYDLIGFAEGPLIQAEDPH